MAKLVTYDLNHADEVDYNKLYDAIKEYDSAKKICESTWLVVSDDSCVEIRDNLKKYMHSKDRIFVNKITNIEAAWSNTICGSDYIKENKNK